MTECVQCLDQLDVFRSILGPKNEETGRKKVGVVRYGVKILSTVKGKEDCLRDGRAVRRDRKERTSTVEL